jgi:L-threonylcarbamoyladenylate synthase
MSAELVAADAPGAVERAVALLDQGGLVAFPTDTVYGVAAHGFQPAAIARLYEVKGRQAGKAIALLVAATDQVRQVARDVPASAWRLGERYWPGALTLVLKRAPSVPDVLSAGGETIAVRMPNHPVALAVIAAAGTPLAVTSANRSGNPDPVSAQNVVRELGDAIDLILDGGTCPGGIPSTVLDLTANPPAIVRQGPIRREDIDQLLSGT